MYANQKYEEIRLTNRGWVGHGGGNTFKPVGCGWGMGDGMYVNRKCEEIRINPCEGRGMGRNGV